MNTELELRHLRVFLAVVEHGSYTQAARSLGVSQSTVSETVAALERALGVTPFRKSRRSLSLTTTGKVLLSHARHIVEQVAAMTGELTTSSREVSTTLAVATVESVSAYLLPSRLSALRARWPKVKVQVLVGVCEQIRDLVAEGKIEVGLTLETARPARGRARSTPPRGDGTTLAHFPLRVVGSSSHPLAGSIVSADQLRRAEFFMCDSGGNYHRELRRAFAAAGLPPPTTQSIGTIEGVKRTLVREPRALSLLPALAVEPDLRDGTLAEIELRPTLPTLALRAICAPGAATSPVVRELLDSLRTEPTG